MAPIEAAVSLRLRDINTVTLFLNFVNKNGTLDIIDEFWRQLYQSLESKSPRVYIRGVAQLVARSVRVAEAAGSSPVTPTIHKLLGRNEALIRFSEIKGYYFLAYNNKVREDILDTYPLFKDHGFYAEYVKK